MVRHDTNPRPAALEQPGDLIDQRLELGLQMSGEARAQLVPQLVEAAGLDPPSGRALLRRPDLLAEEIEPSSRHVVAQSLRCGGLSRAAHARVEVDRVLAAIERVVRDGGERLRGRRHSRQRRHAMAQPRAQALCLQSVSKHPGHVVPKAIREQQTRVLFVLGTRDHRASARLGALHEALEMPRGSVKPGEVQRAYRVAHERDVRRRLHRAHRLERGAVAAPTVRRVARDGRVDRGPS